MMKKIIASILFLGLLIFLPCPSHTDSTNTKVIMKTTEGDIVIELYPEKAPITVKNFLSYVDDKFYDGTIFHRVIKNFMIQGGGYTKDFVEKPSNPPIKNEAKNGLKNRRGTIAMARTMVIDSATCQFFINHKDNPSLNYRDDTQRGYGYAVFGKVIEGMEVVDSIANTKVTVKKGMRNVPVETIEIISIRRMK